MHLRISRVRRNGKTYEYAQLVESYRREKDGMPALRVVASLGQLSAPEIASWRTALEGIRSGKPLVVAESESASRVLAKPSANLDYLDLAVLLEVWNGWGLTKLLDELMPMGDALVPPSAIVAGLTLQRCVEPTPKSYAPEWFAKTALPELLGVAPAQYHNTRLHRVLEELDGISQELGRRLPRLYAEQDGRFVAMFADVTDTWFVGHGPEMAQKGKTKEGRFERKINLALLCNEHGYPLRWNVLPGRQHDSKALLELYGSLRGLSWVGNTPVVCDRAMGNTAHLRGLLETGVHFLTALVRPEFGSYASAIPYEVLQGFVATEEPEPAAADLSAVRKRDLSAVRKLIESTSLTKADDNLYVLDLGVVEQAKPEPAGQEPEDTTSELNNPAIDKTIQAMIHARKLRADLDEKRASSYQSAGRPYGLDKGMVGRYLRLLRLPNSLQDAILRGDAVGLSVKCLARISELEAPDQQQAEFARLIAKSIKRPDKRQTRGASKKTSRPTNDHEKPVKVRAVLYFNPEVFLAQRLSAQKSRAEVQQTVTELNESLTNPRANREDGTINGEIYTLLRKHGLAGVYTYEIILQNVGENRESRQVKLHLNQAEWNKRRRYDGFSVLVGHPQITGSATDLAKLYRSKEAIEYDFHIIKSLVDLRPLHHRTEAKVGAHVTLCMLGLLLERTLRRKLQAGGSGFTSVAALRVLETCRLNMHKAAPGGQAGYCITHPDGYQTAVLRALRLTRLTDDREMIDRITPR